MKRVAIAALVMLVVGVSALPAFAQSTPGQPLGWIYMSSSNTTYNADVSATAFVPFTVYMMLNLDYVYINRADLNPGTGVQAWEAGLIIPADFTILSATVRNESINVGDQKNLIVGLAAPILANQTPTDLVEYSIGAFSPTINLTDVVLDIGPASPSSFSPAAPGMNDSADISECTKISDGTTVKCLRPFAKISRAVINCSAACVPAEERVAVDNTNWGSVKGNFSN